MTATAEFRTIPIGQVHESPLNPRRRFHEGKLQELAASITSHGVLTPLLARPMAGGGFELAAGHRRLRAATLCEFAALPVLVREMSDAEFIEVLTIENLQREDVHALEEAQGFMDLLTHAGYDVARIAARVGRSHRYVYDRLRLLQLVPELQRIFADDVITPGHAVLLARLSPADQLRAVADSNALFNLGSRFKGGELELDDHRKPMAVRELQAWIDQHVRFSPTAADVPELFPQTAELVSSTLEMKLKVIPITNNWHVDPGAKPEDGSRTYTSSSWARADGQHKSKTCDRAVMGVIVVGPGRGEAFKVCVDKKKCTTHWGGEIRDAAQRAKGTPDTPSAAQVRHREEEARREAAQKKEEASRAAYVKALPKILEAVAAQVRTRATGAGGPLGTILIKGSSHRVSHTAAKLMTAGKTADDLVRYLAFITLTEHAGYYHAHEQFSKHAKAIGVDVAKIVAAVNGTSVAAKKAPAAKNAPKKPAAKKKAAK
jgi:ParB/RepB/Spo0J family partition protein